ncbi:hypothetical protein QL285_073595 [Trifolium repens]|nr:hypothetical protein QL285_073595 [Trifolium repens]
MVCCRGFWDCILKLLNFILTVAGFAMPMLMAVSLSDTITIFAKLPNACLAQGYIDVGKTVFSSEGLG